MIAETPIKIYFLYRITNLINTKIYIGQTKNPKNRWRRHRADALTPTMLISRSIKKHGKENFLFEIIATANSLKNANITEINLIKQYNCKVPYGYNVANGGNNLPVCAAWNKGTKGIMNSNSGSFKPGNISWLKGTIGNSNGFQKGHTINVGRKLPNRKRTLGEKTSQARLNNELVLQIVELYKIYTQQKIADKFNVSRATISKIVTGKTWSHVTSLIPIQSY